MNTLVAVLNSAAEDGLISSNPAARWGRVVRFGQTEAQEIEVFTPKELTRLLDDTLIKSQAVSDCQRVAAKTSETVVQCAPASAAGALENAAPSSGIDDVRISRINQNRADAAEVALAIVPDVVSGKAIVESVPACAAVIAFINAKGFSSNIDNVRIGWDRQRIDRASAIQTHVD